MSGASVPYIIVFAAMETLLAGMILILLTDAYIRKRDKRTILIILILVETLILQNWFENSLAEGAPAIMLRTLFSMYGYIIRPVIILHFLGIVGTWKKRRAAWLLVLLNAAVYLTTPFSRLSFYISPDNHFHRGPLGYSCHVVTALLMIQLFYQIILRAKKSGLKQMVIPIFNIVILIAAIAWESIALYKDPLPVVPLTIAIVISCIFYYFWIHMEYVREHEDDLKAQQRIQIMMSQIRPHFLFNTLATIQAMCETDPSGARQAVEKFGLYLRGNMESLEQTGLIPIEKELEHTRVYAEIEMVRFDNIHVEYDIQDTDCSVPALSVQPLVENAIRYGVRGLEKGLVTVTTRWCDPYHEIRISDNGNGFDTKIIENSDGEHIGIRNVRERIEKMCGGTVTFDSSSDGTVVTIRIPGEKE